MRCVYCKLHLVIVSPIRTNRNRPFHMVELQDSGELVPVMPHFPWGIALHTVTLRIVERVTREAEEDQLSMSALVLSRSRCAIWPSAGVRIPRR